MRLSLVIILLLTTGWLNVPSAHADCCYGPEPSTAACLGFTSDCYCRCVHRPGFYYQVTYNGGYVQPYHMDCMTPANQGACPPLDTQVPLGTVLPLLKCAAGSAGRVTRLQNRSCPPLLCTDDCPPFGVLEETVCIC